MNPPVVGVVVIGWPRLSETFIAQELLGLERRGLRLHIVSTRKSTDAAVQAEAREIRAPVLQLPERIPDALRFLSAATRLPGFPRAFRLLTLDLVRDPSADRILRFLQGCATAVSLPAEVGRLYAHFLHNPATVTRYAAAMRRIPWCFSAHAKDIWTTSDRDKRIKIADADWGVTCTAHNLERLVALAPEPERVSLVRHGLDFRRLPAPRRDRPPRDGTDPRDPVRLLSVGRTVEKKGLDTLVDALALLPADLHWRWTHIGVGPLTEELRRRVADRGLDDRVVWRGAVPRDTVTATALESDLFVLPCRHARNGDRDGLPNVLMEASAVGLAIVSTRVSAVPELIEDGTNGLLVPPAAPEALAAALRRLARDPNERSRLGAEAAERVRARFDCESGIDRLAVKFGLTKFNENIQHEEVPRCRSCG